MEATPCFTDGFIYDSMNLIEKFKACDSTDFRVFAEKWKEMEFGKVFHGYTLVAEIREISEEFLRIAKGLMLNGKDLLSRIGGLFLIYGLYYKQPIIGYAKVRFTLEDWDHFKNFCEEINSDEYQNIRHIIFKLYSDDGIVLVCSDKDYGLDRGSLKYFKEPDLKQSIELTREMISLESSVSSSSALNAAKELIEKGKEVQDEYQKIRQELGFTRTRRKFDLSKLLSGNPSQGASVSATKVTAEKDDIQQSKLNSKRQLLKKKAFQNNI